VHDNVTCLDWQQEESSTDHTASSATSYCEGLSLGGYDDWRVPTRIEMASIVDWTRSPATDAIFSGAGAWHRTGSNWVLTIDQIGAGAGTDYGWIYNMSYGMTSNAFSAADSGRVRCVRGNGSGEGYSDKAVPPPNQYTVLSDDDVQDNYTRLIWQRDGAASGLLSQSEGETYCSNLTLGGSSDWRLPTIKELATLVDEAAVAPAINGDTFSNTQYGARQPDTWYWGVGEYGGDQWAINFDDGFTDVNMQAGAWNTFGPTWVKCVRDE
jgi:hypothetical protein